MEINLLMKSNKQNFLLLLTRQLHFKVFPPASVIPEIKNFQVRIMSDVGRNIRVGGFFQFGEFTKSWLNHLMTLSQLFSITRIFPMNHNQAGAITVTNPEKAIRQSSHYLLLITAH